MKRWKNIVTLMIVVGYFPVMFSFVSVSKDNLVCGEIVADVSSKKGHRFITAEDIREIALDKYPEILGKKLDEVNCEEVESFFDEHAAVERCEVYFTYGGALHIDIKQREPIVRIYDGDKSYYMDNRGKKMPLFRNHTAHVLVASGHIRRLPSNDDLLIMVNKVVKDEFWNAQIEQVFVNSSGEFVLVPRVGEHLIEFGGVDRLDEKFANLKALYKNGWDSREWNLYNRVNLKYKGQVVCTKG